MTPLPATNRWKAGKVKNVATVTLGKMLQSTDSGEDTLANYMRAANVQPDGELMLDAKQMWFKAGELDSLSLRHGDVVVVEGGVGGFGRAAYLADDLTGWGFQNSINRLRPLGESDGRFFAYYLIALRASGYIERYCNVVSMPHLTAEKLAALPVPIPEAWEQCAIADYLDRETTRIDTLMKEQQQLIEFVGERRQALLERCVTRGIGEQGSLKPSTLNWTNKVPEHWVVANIRRFAEMKTGHTPSRSIPEYWENCTIPWFTLADVWQLRDARRMYLRDTANSISEIGLANSAAELLPPGTVILSRTASVGYTGIMPTAMTTSQDFWNWVCGPDLLPEYLVYVFRAMRNEFRALMIGSTHKTIYQPVAAAIRIPVPPIEEQHQIVAYLDEQTAKIDTLIDETERFIDLSRERRSALITAAVTGQIDAREVA